MSKSKKDNLETAAEKAASNSSNGRRGFMAGALAVAGASGVGAAATPTAEPEKLQDKKALISNVASELLDQLAADGHLQRASVDELPDQRYARRLGEGALTVQSGTDPQTAFIKQIPNGKLEVNMGGNPVDPYAVVRPDDGENKIYMPDSDGGFTAQPFSALSTDDGVQADVTTSADCDGCYCTTNNNCWLKDYRTVCQSVENGECVSTSDCGCNLY